MLGLSGLVWFGALNQGAYDLWAACVVFFVVTLLVSVYSLWIYPHTRSLKLPLGLPFLVMVGTLWLSVRHAYDTDTSILEAWGWTFTGLIFYLFVNTQETEEDIRQFFQIAGLIVVPLL